MPTWAPKIAASLVSAAAISSFGWVWALNAQIAVLDAEVERTSQSMASAQQHETAIKVLETKLTYIEQGIARIEAALRARTE